MITENSRSVFHCDCGRFLGDVHAIVSGPSGDERILRVLGTCRKHGEVESKTPYDWEEFFPEHDMEDRAHERRTPE
jgi:hypothetical protein